MSKRKAFFIFLVIVLGILASAAMASGIPSEVTSAPHEAIPDAGHEAGHSPVTTFLWIAVILVIAKISGLVEKIGQPSVLGELVIGVVLGNLVLVGISIFEPIKTDAIIRFLAELGVVILLFQIGLESNVAKIRKVGMLALMVAVIGVIAPFVLGAFVAGPLLLPELKMEALIFLGATLTATSVGITARVFQDLKQLKTKSAQIILGAAVIDDILGLIILAVVSALATTGTISVSVVSIILVKAIVFLVGAVVLGQFLAKHLGRLFSKLQNSPSMKFTLAISFALVFAYVAQLMGLAPIIGAFAAGLILDPVHFNAFKKPKLAGKLEKEIADLPAEKKEKLQGFIEEETHSHIEDLIEPIGFLFVPLFFVVTGMDVNLAVLSNIPILLVALGITAAAIIGKIVSGLAVGKKANKWIVGFGMVPRGEVGLIFAAIGKALGVISDDVFSVLVIMVIITTLITPPILAHLLKKENLKKTKLDVHPVRAV